MPMTKKPARKTISNKPAGKPISKKPAGKLQKAVAAKLQKAVQDEIKAVQVLQIEPAPLEQYEQQVKKIGENLWPGIVKKISQAMNFNTANEQGRCKNLAQETYGYMKKTEKLLNLNEIQRASLKTFIAQSSYNLEIEDSF